MKRYRKSYRTIKKKSPLDLLKIFKHKMAWFILLGLITIGGLIYFFIFSSVFQIKNINISALEKSSSEEIYKIISANAGNIFLADFTDSREKILNEFPQIVEVNIKREFPNGVFAEIKERQPVAIFCKSELDSNIKIFGERNSKVCYYIDNQGIVFEKVVGEPSDLVVIRNNSPLSSFSMGQQVIEIDYLEKVLKINLGLKDIQITEIIPVSNERLDIKTSEGWEIYFNTKEDIDWQIKELGILLKEKLPTGERKGLEYVDLRFEKVYFKKSN